MNNNPLNREAELIGKFDNLTNKKKIVVLAKRIYTELTDELDKILIASIIKAKDPAKHLDFCRRRIQDCYGVIEQFIEDGAHGMIIHNGAAYPVKINARENWLVENSKWNPDDEREIQEKLVKTWMEENNKKTFAGKIALFPKFGFSGVPGFWMF